MRILLIALSLFSVNGFAANYNLQYGKGGVVDFDKFSERPYRSGFYKMVPSLDREKPIGLADYSGWAFTSGRIIGSVEKDWVMAFDAKTKNALWRTKIDADLTAPIFVAGRWIVVGTRSGEVLKIEHDTGKVVWKASLDSFVSRKMVLSGAALYLVTASQHLYSINLQSGKINWLYDGGFPPDLVVRTTAAPLVYNQNVYFGVSTGEIISVSGDKGNLNWKFSPKFSSEKFLNYVGEMVIVKNHIIFTRYDGLFGVISIGSSPTGTAWSHQLPSIASSTFRGGRIYIGMINGDVQSYEASTGKILWRNTTGESVANITAGENSVYLSGSDGKVSVLNSIDGKTRWIDKLEGRLVGPGIYIESDIYFATGAKNLYGYKVN